MYNIDELYKNLSDEQRFLVLIISFASVLIIYLGLFILKAVALCRMAKKRGFSNWWLGMIPYANFYLIGKLAGPIRLFNYDFKNMGIVALISAILLDVTKVFSIFNLFELFPTLALLYTGVYTASYFVELIYYVSTVTMYFALFSKYVPHKRLLFTLLSLIQPAFPILLIIIMNRKPYNSFDDYYGEEMAKKYGQTYNPYTNPYSTNENPFNQTNNKSTNGERPEDPFEEFKGE